MAGKCQEEAKNGIYVEMPSPAVEISPQISSIAPIAAIVTIAPIKYNTNLSMSNFILNHPHQCCNYYPRRYYQYHPIKAILKVIHLKSPHLH
jgi:hypothetical protein